jgi:protein SCO1/2
MDGAPELEVSATALDRTPEGCDGPEGAGVGGRSDGPRASRGRAMRIAISVGGLTLALTLALVARAIRPRPPLPVLGHIPSFHLVDERGAAYATDSMLGHVTVVDFVFTKCTASCPRLTARMGELQARLARGGDDDVKLVSFSVDPDNDTPPVLAEYAAKAHADPTRWRFVTGGVDDIARAVVLGFKVSAAKIAKGANDYEVTHGDWFVLVDRAGDVRGYYAVDEPGDVAPLYADARRLERRGR